MSEGRPIRIRFENFWQPFDWRRHFGFLAERFTLVESDDPDFVIFSVFENGVNQWRMPRLRTRAVRIFFTAENVPPEMEHCDFAFGFVHEERVESERYHRLPNYPLRLWACGLDSEVLLERERDAQRLLAAKTRFCNFIYTNPRCETRNAFFEKLSRYKRVDAPGLVCNNLPELPRPDAYAKLGPKLDFVRQCKFTIAFENVSSPGYTTEKIVEPMLVDSLPIYWGDPEVGRDFETRSFLSYFDGCRSLDDLVDLVVAVDRDERLYAEYLRQPWLVGNRLTPQLERKRVADWFGAIFGV